MKVVQRMLVCHGEERPERDKKKERYKRERERERERE